MCLFIDKVKTKDFLHVHKHDKSIDVWKVVAKRQTLVVKKLKIVTPIVGTKVKPGFLKARNIWLHKFMRCISSTDNIITRGAIHVYLSEERFPLLAPLAHKAEIIRCSALIKDFIAVGDMEDACFTQIFIPEDELNRIREQWQEEGEKSEPKN